ncbi:MAG: helix-turn-helix transcriptional regulator [Syntrophomonadaceae bacterium]|nr:helix-turn-helix transcriptional regulator [Syntrophomonadaceae bacterium]
MDHNRFPFGEQPISDEDLAPRVGVSRQTIISLEKGRYNPSLVLAYHLARVFNLRIGARWQESTCAIFWGSLSPSCCSVIPAFITTMMG